jgi:hypothetical protein
MFAISEAVNLNCKYKEVNRTEPYPSVRVPWSLHELVNLGACTIKFLWL